MNAFGRIIVNVKSLKGNQVYKPNPRQYFQSIEAIYNARMSSFIALANSHLFNSDYSIDAVHDALAKAQMYFEKHPERKVRERVVRVLILRACKKYNKYNNEVGFEEEKDS